MPDHFISIEKAENDLLDCAAYLAERIKSSDGHAEAMNSIIPQYLAKGDVDLAAELANAIDDPFSRDKLLIAVAVKCAEVDDEDYGLQLADAIEDHGLQSQAFERIGLILAGKGKLERAAEVGDLMGHSDFVDAAIAVHESSTGNDAAADETIENIEFPTARVSALQQIGASQIDAGKTAEGIATIEEAVAAAGEIEHDEEQIRTLCGLGNVFLDAKANDKAIETFDLAKSTAETLDNQHRDYFLVTCAMGFLNSGSTDLADRTLDLVTDKTHMASAMLGFARHYWGKDEKDDALDSVEEAYAIIKSQGDGETRDSKARNALFTNISTQFAAFGKGERAVEAAFENPDPNQQMNGLAQIAQIMTMKGDDAFARDTISQIEDDSNRLFALIAMADTKRKLEDRPAAIEILDEASTLAETVPQLSARSEVLNEIADRFVTLGESEKTRTTAIENLNVISQIRDESTRAVSIANLAAIYDRAELKPGDAELAVMRKFANEIAF